jgi:ubiquitin-protein ligase
MLQTASSELIAPTQMLSVISLLSSESPNLDSPANVDAAKEVRTDFASLYLRLPLPPYH